MGLVVSLIHFINLTYKSSYFNVNTAQLLPTVRITSYSIRVCWMTEQCGEVKEMGRRRFGGTWYSGVVTKRTVSFLLCYCEYLLCKNTYETKFYYKYRSCISEPSSQRKFQFVFLKRFQILDSLKEILDTKY